jgi:Ca-activated chloride channel family protein
LARHVLIVLRVAGFSLLIVALARPQFGSSYEEITTYGVDIMVAFDNSGSMAALDFKPYNRLEVARRTFMDFVDSRSHDRIGLVVFAGRAYTKCPLTLDYDLLKQLASQIDLALPQEDGTAIGTAIATAANRLLRSSAKSKVIILLTDGANNRGEISPIAAARASAELGIRIHAVGIGMEGEVPFPVRVQNPLTGRVTTQIQMIPSDLDIETLQEIAQITGGRYFRAESAEELQEIYEEINSLEKSTVEVRAFTDWSEKFHPYLIWGFVLLAVEFILRQTRFRRVP